MAAIRALAEIVLVVGDLQKSVAFYRDVLGLTVISPPETPATFLRVGAEGAGVPQQVVLVPRPAGSPAAAADRMARGLHHIGLEVATADLEVERSRLAGLGYAVRAGTHPFLPVEAFYLDDPDGNEVEIVARSD